jgi:O-acetyl-ADP-ribose deacetylase (regulator of RNase III)
MPEPKRPQNFRGMIHKLQQSFEEDAEAAFSMPEQDVDQLLAEEGIDPSATIAKIRDIVGAPTPRASESSQEPAIAIHTKLFFGSVKHFWTHPSVVSLNTPDPIEFVCRKASEIVLNAIQAGWSGPPFDSAKLAEFLGHKLAPTADVADARIVPCGERRYQIEFNPAKSSSRVRFSIAHELAHTIFPDCWRAIRHRLSKSEQRDDDWQLEMLCNLAAAEFLMPVAQFPQLRDAELSIRSILKLREDYKVSAEAVLLRVARLTEAPCAVFAASERAGERFGLEYAVASRAWPVTIASGTLLPKETHLKECTAIGYTAIGQEEWLPKMGPVEVQCVRISPFPGESIPRLVGFIRPQSFTPVHSGKITLLRGDATEPRGDRHKKVIAFIVNDKTPNWGAGFALGIRRKWPEAQTAFRTWATTNPSLLSLGNVFHSDVVDEEITTFQMICQHGYGKSPTPRIRYAYLKICLEKLAQFASTHKASIHMPKIATGYGGGSWQLVEQMIDETLCARGLDVTVYELPHQSQPQPNLFDYPHT